MTTIAFVGVDHYRIPLPVVLSDSTHGDIAEFELVTVRVRDALGIEGLGYTYTVGRGGAAVAVLIRDDLSPVLAGRECREGPLPIQPGSVRARPNRASQTLTGVTALDLPAQAEGAKADRTGAGSYPCRKCRSASRLSCSACLVTRAFVAR
jgi:L-alanine-DL-glutamate epimerase-like enolase superfamily enzyme